MSSVDRRSSFKTLSFACLMVLLIVAVIEVGSMVMLAIRYGNFPTLDLVAADRATVLGSSDRAKLTNLGDDYLRQPQTLHPYTGFIYEPPDADEIDPGRPNLPAFEDRLFFEPSAQRVVIGVLGGSVAEIAATGGSGLEVELRKVDRFAGREIEVVSLAFGGFKQPQQLTALAYYLALGAHFDVIINIDGFNEVALPEAELVSRQVFPFYPRGWDRRVGPLKSEVRGLVASQHEEWQRRRDLAQRYSEWPLANSHTAAVVWHVLDRLAVRRQTSLDDRLLNEDTEAATYASHGPRREYQSKEEMYRDLARVWFRSSLQIHWLCQAQGIEYYHFLQPNQYVEGSKPMAAEEEAGMWRGDHRYRSGVVGGYPLLVDFGHQLVEQGVDFVDLTDIFEDREELLYSDACCHFNFLGNTLLERAVARQLADGDFHRAENLSDGNLALEGYDPVSYFEEGPVPGRAEISVEHDGISYRFASRSHQSKFLGDPQRYLPQFGGWCAYGLGLDEAEMSIAPERYPVDPENYEIVDGHLYLFYRSPRTDGRELWRRNPDLYLGRARDVWQRITNAELARGPTSKTSKGVALQPKTDSLQ